MLNLIRFGASKGFLYAPTGIIIIYGGIKWLIMAPGHGLRVRAGAGSGRGFGSGRAPSQGLRVGGFG